MSFKKGNPNSLRSGSVLILSASSATGHLRAADALATSFQAKGVAARHVEVLRYTNPIFKRIYSDLYVDLMTRQPDLPALAYKIDTLLADEERFGRMKENVKRVARPHAASDIVSFVLGSNVWQKPVIAG